MSLHLRGILLSVVSRRSSATRMVRLCAIVAVATVASQLTALASPIVYTVNDTVSAGTVTGTITTDGNLGTLVTADITGWNLVLENGFGTTLDLTGPSTVTPIEGVDVVGADLTASASTLSFNFSATDGGFFLIQENGLFNGGTYFCDGAIGQANCTAGGESDFPGVLDSDNQQFAARTGTITIGSANVSTVPEPSALILLLTGMLGLVFLGRKRRA
jgi:hypothetical protein